MIAPCRWILTADRRRAALYACARAPGGRVHLEEVCSIRNEHEAEHERGRPAILGGAERRGARAASSALASPQAASFGHTEAEERRRFARDVSRWLEQARRELMLDPLSVLAPPHLLGLLRDEMGGLVRPADFHAADLAHLPVVELAEHREVKEILGV